ncbi:MAG: electron transfer flavoprotein subunit beta/FixA family protein [Kineosporiaceae bacterium]|nr:electron transfer flavoprotein subunit beta/FixA family protein [Kineosporiaceae bacterium]MBK8077305.1 electron transfer flavoprotein subunit beta/FixA family protein [Kineosporiaceae bacterium]
MPNVLVCIKRVAGSSGQVLLSADAMSVDARHVGHTLSPHEECAIEAAVQIASETGGAATVLTLGPDGALEQLREALAVGITSAVHLRTADEGEPGSVDAFGPADVAEAIADVVRRREAAGEGFDLVLVGNDAADTGDFQVGVRVAYLLGRPVVTGARTVAVAGSTVTVVGDGPQGTEEFEVPLPAVVTVKEGEITPRYPSIPGRLKAKKAPVEVVEVAAPAHGTGRRTLILPPEQPSTVQVLGTDKDTSAAAAAVVDVLHTIGVVTK